MARKPLEIEINEKTPQADLEFCAHCADHSSDINLQRKSAEAIAESTRREQVIERGRFNAQESARVKAQEFQKAERLASEDFQKGQSERHLNIADKQLTLGWCSAIAAGCSAIAAIGLVILTWMK